MNTSYTSTTTVQIDNKDLKVVSINRRLIQVNGNSHTLNLEFDSSEDLVTFTQMLLKGIRATIADPDLRYAYVYSYENLPDLFPAQTVSD